MAYTTQDLTREIREQHALISAQNSGATPKGWLVRQVIALHPDVVGDDADFAVLCAQAHVSAQVDKYIRGIKERELAATPDPQTMLPGYTRVQAEYVLQHQGESLILSVLDMTDEQLEAKAIEHESMGSGHYQHARELRRFISDPRRRLVA